MFDSPRYIVNTEIKTTGAYIYDEDRDYAMTINSDKDIAWVRSKEEYKKLYGKFFRPNRISGTENNLLRRQRLNTSGSIN